jgi:HTH-type transcriptional regulator/antitoxin HigA
MTDMAISLKPIRTESDYEDALDRIQGLMMAQPNTPEADELAVLGILVEVYEEEHYPIQFPDPIAAIRFRLEQSGLEPVALTPYIGSFSEVEAVLSGQIPLTLPMIRALHKHLGIPADVLLQEPPV